MKNINKSWKDHQEEMLKKDSKENYIIAALCFILGLIVIFNVYSN